MAINTVCFFNSTIFWGGGEKLHLEYAEQFYRKGYNTVLMANKAGELFPKGKNAGINTVHISAGNLSFLNPIKLYQLSKLYKKLNISTIFFSTSQDAKLGSIAAKLAGVKHIIYLRGLAVAINPSYINKYILNKAFTHLLVNSKETARKMQEKFNSNFPKEKIKVIYHGIDLNEFDAIPIVPEERPLDKAILGNAGRLTTQKGQHLLIDVAKHLRDANANFKIRIAGTGELEQDLKIKIKNEKLEDYIELCGFISDIKSFMAGLDIFVLPSLWEGFGYVIVEAMAVQKPVVAFNTSSNPEIITHSQTGFLVPNEDTKIMADRLLHLINEPALRKKLAINARRSVEERFELSDRITEIEEYLNLRNA